MMPKTWNVKDVFTKSKIVAHSNFLKFHPVAEHLQQTIPVPFFLYNFVVLYFSAKPYIISFFPIRLESVLVWFGVGALLFVVDKLLCFSIFLGKTLISLSIDEKSLPGLMYCFKEARFPISEVFFELSLLGRYFVVCIDNCGSGKSFWIAKFAFWFSFVIFSKKKMFHFIVLFISLNTRICRINLLLCLNFEELPESFVKVIIDPGFANVTQMTKQWNVLNKINQNLSLNFFEKIIPQTPYFVQSDEFRSH